MSPLHAGLYLHRLYQLGLDGKYFQGKRFVCRNLFESVFLEGVRPHLSVFYQSVKTRPSFVRVTDWKNRIRKGILMFFCGTSLLLCPRSEERRVLSEEDKILENAKWGVGIAAILGKL